MPSRGSIKGHRETVSFPPSRTGSGEIRNFQSEHFRKPVSAGASGGYLSWSGKKGTKEPARGGADREAYRYILQIVSQGSPASSRPPQDPSRPLSLPWAEIVFALWGNVTEILRHFRPLHCHCEEPSPRRRRGNLNQLSSALPFLDSHRRKRPRNDMLFKRLLPALRCRNDRQQTERSLTEGALQYSYSITCRRRYSLYSLFYSSRPCCRPHNYG